MNEITYVTGSESPVFTLNASAYPDGLPLVSRGWEPPPSRILVRPTSVLSLMTALWWVDALVERGGKPPVLCLPCLPGARQDRLNSQGDYLFTAKSVAMEINLRGFPRVVTLDAHSDVMPALIDRCDVIPAVDVIRTYVPHEPYEAAIAPDGGAVKRASAVAKMFGVPLLHAWKTRDVATGNISGFGIQDPGRPLRALVVDDLCDGGGTFIGLAAAMREKGIAADLWTTHGLYTKGTEGLRLHYHSIFCTDSVHGPREGVTEIPVCERLLRGAL